MHKGGNTYLLCANSNHILSPQLKCDFLNSKSPTWLFSHLFNETATMDLGINNYYSKDSAEDSSSHPSWAWQLIMKR